jgi:DNA repair exonuclease SbcCD nuclease subunit
MKKKLNKGLCFTDIHFGKKNNSIIHNTDCLNFIKWIVEVAKTDTSIDHISFLGDWHEQRNAINGLTLDYSYEAASELNSLGIPIYFIVGNHDLFFRNNRDVFTTRTFESLEHFVVIDKITVVPEMGDAGAVFVPFLFENEFPSLLEYTEYPIVFGHFEFAGFVVTGDTIVKESGPSALDYKSFKKIFSGHYHKRQNQGNIHYIGNTFPMDFSDANDFDRGYMIYEFDKDSIEYVKWDESPSYVKCSLSDVLSSPKKWLKERSIVNCLVDQDLEYHEAIELKERLITKFKLREFNLVEPFSYDEAITGTNSINFEGSNKTIEEMIQEMISTIDVKGIDNKLLLKIYGDIK